MKKYKIILLGYLAFFILGYGYGVIDALSGFTKIQVGVSAFAVIVCFMVIVLSKPRDANVAKSVGGGKNE